jgi:hypothetical protein
LSLGRKCRVDEGDNEWVGREGAAFCEIKEGLVRRGSWAAGANGWLRNFDDAKRLVSVGPADEHDKERIRVCKILRGNNYIY